MVHPDVPSLTKINGSVTVSQVPNGGSSTAVVDIGAGYIIIGMPHVSTTTANATVKVINGGEHEFTVEADNSGTAASDVVVDYIVYAVKNV